MAEGPQAEGPLAEGPLAEGPLAKGPYGRRPHWPYSKYEGSSKRFLLPLQPLNSPSSSYCLWWGRPVSASVLTVRLIGT